MRGQIVVFNAPKNAGVIITEDGQRLLFHVQAWQDLMPPESGMAVEFSLDDKQQAQQIQIALPAASQIPAAALSLAQRPKRKPVLTLLALFLGIFGAHRFYMGTWGWGLVQLLAVPLVIGIFAALLPALGGLLYIAAIVFIWVEAIRYIWMSDAEFDAKVQTYQAAQPGPFSFFW